MLHFIKQFVSPFLWDFLPIFGICRYFYFWTSALILMLSRLSTMILHSVTRERKQTSSWEMLRVVKRPFRLFPPPLNQTAYITSYPNGGEARLNMCCSRLQYFGLDTDQTPLIFVLTMGSTKYVQRHVQPDNLASWLKDCKVMNLNMFSSTRSNFTYLLFSRLGMWGMLLLFFEYPFLSPICFTLFLYECRTESWSHTWSHSQFQNLTMKLWRWWLQRLLRIWCSIREKMVCIIQKSTTNFVDVIIDVDSGAAYCLLHFVVVFRCSTVGVLSTWV